MNSLSSKNNKVINWMLVVIFTMAVSLSSSVAVFAQDETKTEAGSDTVAVNKTMKSLFSEAKKVAKKDDGNLFSIIMITVVVIIVIIAVWLSFRPDAEDIAREKKKKEAAAAKM